jgi:hypothetical protein
MLPDCLNVDEEQGHKSQLAANHKFAAEKCGWTTIVVSSQALHLGSRNPQMATAHSRSRCHFAVARPVHDGGPSRAIVSRGWRRRQRSRIDHMSGN